MRVLAFIVALEAATLAVVVALVLHSESHDSFPPAVATPQLVRAKHRAVAIPAAVGSTGTVETAALSTARGGHAAATGSPPATRAPSGESGSVGSRIARDARRVRHRARASSHP
jgi:hypothetical protein